MGRGKRWSKEEELVLFDQVSRHADNLSAAMNSASRITGRTAHACTNYWYRTLSKREDADTAFMCVSSKLVIRNRKHGSTDSNKSSIWNKIKRLLHIK